METLIGQKIVRNKEMVNANLLLGAKEFVILFYGARWDKKSCEVANKLN